MHDHANAGSSLSWMPEQAVARLSFETDAKEAPDAPYWAWSLYCKPCKVDDNQDAPPDAIIAAMPQGIRPKLERETHQQQIDQHIKTGQLLVRIPGHEAHARPLHRLSVLR